MSAFQIAWRELKRYFRSPSSFLILAMFLFYQGLVFYLLVRVLNRPDAPHSPPMRWFFGGVIWFYPVFVFLVAMLTQGLLADEQRSRSIETLMTAPVRESEVVLGKFLGAMGFFVFMWLWTLLYVWLLSSMSKGQGINAWPIVSGYLGTLLIGMLGISFGIFCSSLTRDTMFAGMATVIGLLMIFILKLMSMWDIFSVPGDQPGKLLGIISPDTLKAVVEYVMIIDYMDDFSKGIVDTRYVIFLVSGTALFLFSAVRILQQRKWR
jgi:ABC-2 type transport system permease protein